MAAVVGPELADRQQLSSGSGWNRLQPELLERIADYICPNEIAGTLRLLNKSTAVVFNGPLHTIMRLSQPSPRHAFAHHWARIGAVAGFTLNKRRELQRLTAASGVLSNLQLAIQSTGCLPTAEVAGAAAAGGHLELVQYLAAEGCPLGEPVLVAAAKTGQRSVCEWLVQGNHSTWSPVAVGAAATGGHAVLCAWLVDQHSDKVEAREGTLCCRLAGAAATCSFEHFQRLCQEEGVTSAIDMEIRLVPYKEQWWSQQQWQWLHCCSLGPIMQAAASSPTEDWAAKVEWLEAMGFPKATGQLLAAVGRQHEVNRLTWLTGRGCCCKDELVLAVARTGDLAALHAVLDAHIGGTHGMCIMEAVARSGNLEALQLLFERYGSYGGTGGRSARSLRSLTMAAAAAGQQSILDWALQALAASDGLDGPTRLGARLHGSILFAEAAKSGSVELLAWLRDECDCGWDAQAWTNAAGAGCESALTWLAERGCPMPKKGEPYVVTATDSGGDQATLHCLHRLHVPMHEETVMGVLRGLRQSAGAPVLRWLLEAGCPVAWGAAVRFAKGDHMEATDQAEVLALLADGQRQRQQQQQRQRHRN